MNVETQVIQAGPTSKQLDAYYALYLRDLFDARSNYYNGDMAIFEERVAHYRQIFSLSAEENDNLVQRAVAELRFVDGVIPEDFADAR